MEKLITREEARRHGLWCRVKFRWHLASHKYENYELCPPDGRPAVLVVTYKRRLGRTWTCWVRPSPESLWEKYTDAGSFGERLEGMTRAEDRSLPAA
jgi:hypothetical protein